MLNKSKEQAYYEYLHNVYRPMDLYQIKHNNIYIYNIPKDIIKYIYFQNKQIHIKKEHSESLSEKLLYCKYYIEIDINYFKFLQFGMLGGEIIGIKNSRGKCRSSLILFTISDEHNIGIYDICEQVFRNERLKKIINGYIPSRERIFVY